MSSSPATTWALVTTRPGAATQPEPSIPSPQAVPRTRTTERAGRHHVRVGDDLRVRRRHRGRRARRSTAPGRPGRARCRTAPEGGSTSLRLLRITECCTSARSCDRPGCVQGDCAEDPDQPQGNRGNQRGAAGAVGTVQSAPSPDQPQRAIPGQGSPGPPPPAPRRSAHPRPRTTARTASPTPDSGAKARPGSRQTRPGQSQGESACRRSIPAGTPKAPGPV